MEVALEQEVEEVVSGPVEVAVSELADGLIEL